MRRVVAKRLRKLARSRESTSKLVRRKIDRALYWLGFQRQYRDLKKAYKRGVAV